MKKYDYLVVGAGLYGAVFANQAKAAGRKVGLFGVEKEPFSWRKVIGMGIALIGTTIFQWK